MPQVFINGKPVGGFDDLHAEPRGELDRLCRLGVGCPSVTVFELPPWFWMGVGVSLGLVFGSFLNVVIHRLPRGENLAFPASHCPSCGTPIRAFDNLPVLGWLRLRGKARCCKAPISPRYPLVELLGGLLGGALIQVAVLTLPPDTPLWQGGLLFCAYLALGLSLIAAAFIDLSQCTCPTRSPSAVPCWACCGPLPTEASLSDSLLGAGYRLLAGVATVRFVASPAARSARHGLG